ncbi:proline-rich proteoglycan 2-like [Schistocerca cancellata]|uniref:proline-rich proteoglycan 2-like n=1 Tax=Schistocerca cancellata TaxID=274614 RepID=UPI00211996A4|nr:proline-rich proteoglycan 2-like [Schistocerca cancellata]
MVWRCPLVREPSGAPPGGSRPPRPRPPAGLAARPLTTGSPATPPGTGCSPGCPEDVAPPPTGKKSRYPQLLQYVAAEELRKSREGSEGSPAQLEGRPPLADSRLSLCVPQAAGRRRQAVAAGKQRLPAPAQPSQPHKFLLRGFRQGGLRAGDASAQSASVRSVLGAPQWAARGGAEPPPWRRDERAAASPAPKRGGVATDAGR